MKKVIINILSLLFTIFTVIGNSFMITDSFKFLYQDFLHILCAIIFAIIVFILIRYIINGYYNILDKSSEKELKVNKFTKFFNEHPFIVSFIIIVICWLPYFISFYPAILSPDPTFQIKQFFHIPNKYSDYVVLLDPNVIITNHHPVLHTLLLGGSLKLGHMMGNDNLGLFIYIIIQSITLIGTLSYTIKFLKRIGLSDKYRLICLIIYALIPVFPLYTMTCVKDVFFGSFVILFISYLYLILTDKLNKKEMICFILVSLLMALVRNNGIYVLLLTLIPLIFIKLKNKKQYLIILIIPICLYYSYDKFILPAFKITPTSVREMLSIPFQQTARYVKYHEDKVSSKEKDAIDQVLGYDTLKKRYNSEKSDPVKNEYNRYATKKDLMNYFKYWFKGFFKAPVTYIEATISNTYGYLYPAKTNWYIYYDNDERIRTEDHFNYHLNKLNHTRKILKNYGLVFPYIPIIGMFVNIGFNSWLLLIMLSFLIIKKQYKKCLYLLPAFILLLTCFASPVNCYFRYSLPYIFAMPLMFGMFIKLFKYDKMK